MNATDQIKDKLPLADWLQDHGHVTLKRDGHNMKGTCPFHSENTPSFVVYPDNHYFCFGCAESGDLFTFYQKIYNVDFQEALRVLTQEAGVIPAPRRKAEAPKPSEKPKPQKLPTIPMETAEQYHQKLPPERREYYRKRGLSDETIDRFRLGWDSTRYTIPIVINGELVNIRRRKDDQNRSDNSVKMLPYKAGHGTAVVFNQDSIKDAESIIIAEGEFDAMLLCQHGWLAVSPTGGAETFKPEWLSLFDSCRVVYICYDNDIAGRSGTNKAAALFGDRARIVTLPEEVGDKGDVTDFFVKLGKTDSDFAELLQAAKIYEPPPLVPEEEIKQVHLAQSAHSELVSKKVEVKILCAGKLDAPYIVPRKVRYICYANDRDREACGAANDEERCNGYWDKTLDDKESTFIELCQKKKPQLGGILKHMAGCQANCKKFSYQILEYSNVEQVLAVPMAERVIPTTDASGHTVDMDENGNEYVARNLYLLDDKATVNQYYRAVGRVYPHPDTQLGTILITKQEPMQDNIEQFKMTDEIKKAFRVFQPQGDLVKHVDALLGDLTANVTQIYNRDRALLAVLLTYHSVLGFMFEGKRIRRGWVETLLLGDTGEGKTELVRSMIDFCGLGQLASGETARRTGLCYSVQQIGERWFVKWGTYVLNDRRLLAIDELSELPLEDLGRMTQGRNDGVMRVEQAGVGEANCRTRLIWMSNPRGSKQLENYSHGIEALKTLFPTPADLRRIDFVVLLAAKDLDAREINKMRTKPDQQLITGAALKHSILWAWSRKSSDVVISDETTEAILDKSRWLSAKYGAAGDVPLTTAADIRNKLARMCVALAAFLHSTDDEHEKIMVERIHVDFISTFLDEVYKARNCRYDVYAGYAAKKSTLDETEAAEIALELRQMDGEIDPDTKKPVTKLISQEILALYRRNDTLTTTELADLLDVDRRTIAKRLRVLQRHGLIVKGRYGYNKTPKLVEYLARGE